MDIYRLGGRGSRSDGYDGERYISCDVFLTTPRMERPEKEGTNPMVIVMAFLIGLFNALSPGATWCLSHGWMDKDVELSPSALAMIQVGSSADCGGYCFAVRITCRLRRRSSTI